ALGALLVAAGRLGRRRCGLALVAAAVRSGLLGEEAQTGVAVLQDHFASRACVVVDLSCEPRLQVGGDVARRGEPHGHSVVTEDVAGAGEGGRLYSGASTASACAALRRTARPRASRSTSSRRRCDRPPACPA